MRRIALRTAAFAAGLALAAVAPSLANDSGPSPNTPGRAEMTDEGAVLVTSAGMTLYTFGVDDGAQGQSRCTNVPKTSLPDPTAGLGVLPFPHGETQRSCIQQMPPYIAAADAKPSGEWSLIDRPEGGKQWAYRGRPLYTAIVDKKPGDMYGASGGGFGAGRGFRFAAVPPVFPPGVKYVRREEGLVLATADDRPVYTPHGKIQQACEGCAELFRPVVAPALAGVGGDWSIVDAGAGRHQYSYKGLPLYAAPSGLLDSEIADAGGWDLVVYRKGPATPSEVDKRFTLVGEVYTDKAGKTLYSFNCTTPSGDGVRCDNPGDAATYWVALCGDSKECSKRWRPYLAAEGAKPVGDWSIAEVSDPIFTDAKGFTYPADAPRVKAWAYRGKPVFTYYQDKGPGDIFGHGTRWFSYSSLNAVQVPGHSVLE